MSLDNFVYVLLDFLEKFLLQLFLEPLEHSLVNSRRLLLSQSRSPKVSPSVDGPAAKFKLRSEPGEAFVVDFSDGGSTPPASTKNICNHYNIYFIRENGDCDYNRIE